MLPHTGLFLLWKVALQMRIRRHLDCPIFIKLYFEENNLISFENKILNNSNISEQDTEESSKCLHIIEIRLKLPK